jgi:hypothetical protein
MIKIAIIQAAFDAIVATLPVGSAAYEAENDDRSPRNAPQDSNRTSVSTQPRSSAVGHPVLLGSAAGGS